MHNRYTSESTYYRKNPLEKIHRCRLCNRRSLLSDLDQYESSWNSQWHTMIRYHRCKKLRLKLQNM